MKDTMVMINRICNRVRRQIDREVAALGITAIQGRVINFIKKTNKDVYQKDLEEYLEIRGSSVTAMIKAMEKNDLLYRLVDKDDQRLKHLVLTPKAQEIHSKIMKIIAREEKATFGSLSYEEQKNLNTLLEKVISSYEK